MDPTAVVIQYLQTHFPWVIPTYSLYAIVGPVIVHAGKWEATRIGHIVLSTSFDVWGSAKGPRLTDQRPAPAPADAPKDPTP